jgi:hypothetical protein
MAAAHGEAGVQAEWGLHVTRLGASMHRDPRDVVLPFFKDRGPSGYRIQRAAWGNSSVGICVGILGLG